jgi:hypothetical protein
MQPILFRVISKIKPKVNKKLLKRIMRMSEKLRKMSSGKSQKAFKETVPSL